MASSLPPLAQAAAGAVGAVVSNSLLYPLDVLTTRMQTARRSKKGTASPYGSLLSAIRTILKEEGAAAFFRGILPDSLSTALSNFLYFFSYSFLHKFLLERKARRNPSAKPLLLSAVEELLVGCLAGVVAKGVVSPLSNITVRMQTATAAKAKIEGAAEKEEVPGDSSDDDDSPYGSSPTTLDIAKEIYEEKGWTGFWSGFKSSIILTTNPAITFYLFDVFKRAVIPLRHQEHPTPAQTFLSSAFASSIASAITYPLILSKTRLQFKSPSGRRLFRSNYDVFAKTITREGIMGMYAGLEGQLVKGFLSEGVKMTIKERMELAIVMAHQIATRRQQRAVA